MEHIIWFVLCLAGSPGSPARAAPGGGGAAILAGTARAGGGEEGKEGMMQRAAPLIPGRACLALCTLAGGAQERLWSILDDGAEGGSAWPPLSKPCSPERGTAGTAGSHTSSRAVFAHISALAVRGFVLRNGQSTAPASARSSFPPHPEQRNSFFFYLFTSDGEKRDIPEGCTVTHGLLSSFGMHGVFTA